LKVELDEVDGYLLILAETPRRLADCAAGLSDEQLENPPIAGEWSLRQVLAHLRAAAEVWGEAIAMTLGQHSPDIPYEHPNRRMKAAGYAALDFKASLEAYTHQRRALLETLRHLQPGDWSRPATIRGRTHTVFGQTRRMALHEADHWAQIERLGEC
jgi:uncharacterized damage-inducible protein DinB